MKPRYASTFLALIVVNSGGCASTSSSASSSAIELSCVTSRSPDRRTATSLTVQALTTSGGTVPDAVLVLESGSDPSRSSRELTSGASGVVTLPVQTGVWRVSVSAPGFIPASQEVNLLPDNVCTVRALLARATSRP